jgi:hypothetical protein
VEQRQVSRKSLSPTVCKADNWIRNRYEAKIFYKNLINLPFLQGILLGEVNYTWIDGFTIEIRSNENFLSNKC